VDFVFNVKKQNISVSYANSFDLQKPQPQLNTVHDVVSI